VTTTLEPSRLRPTDVVRVAMSGLLARRLRALLSALGVSIGIASLVGVLGLSESSRSELLDRLSALGTNLLTVQAGTGFGLGDATLPGTSVAMVERIATVERTSSITRLPLSVYRNDLIPEGETGGISVYGTDPGMLATLGGSMAEGSFLGGAATELPAAVLGSVAAGRLGIGRLDEPISIRIGGRWVPVVGIMEPLPVQSALDRAVFIGDAAARDYFDADAAPTLLGVRVRDDQVTGTRDLLPATVNPENPEEVEVSRPSDVLEAQAAAESAFSSLFLGLGAVALLVGGIGIANVMVIGVMERRGEIGLRRAMGATEGHIRSQFLTEALILSLLGGAVGVLVGAAVTAGYATVQGWRVIIPAVAVWGGIVAALVIGAVAGLYPAIRAARLPPTEALRSE